MLCPRTVVELCGSLIDILGLRRSYRAPVVGIENADVASGVMSARPADILRIALQVNN